MAESRIRRAIRYLLRVLRCFAGRIMTTATTDLRNALVVERMGDTTELNYPWVRLGKSYLGLEALSMAKVGRQDL